MESRAKLPGHPIHPMRIVLPWGSVKTRRFYTLDFVALPIPPMPVPKARAWRTSVNEVRRRGRTGT